MILWKKAVEWKGEVEEMKILNKNLMDRGLSSLFDLSLRRFLIRKLCGFLWYFHVVLDNSGVADMDKSGEGKLLERLIEFFGKRFSRIVVFDVGANVGDWTWCLLKSFLNRQGSQKLELEIHCFEPVSSSFVKLNSRFVDEKFAGAKIITNNFGLSDKEEEKEIYFQRPEDSHASLYAMETGMKVPFASECVSLKRADRYISEKCIEHINFLKIDVEGHEYHVLVGFGDYLNSDFIDFIQFEYGGCNLVSHSSLKDIYAYLIQKGFRIGKIMRNGKVDLRDWKPFMENFQYSNYIAVSRRLLI